MTPAAPFSPEQMCLAGPFQPGLKDKGSQAGSRTRKSTHRGQELGQAWPWGLRQGQRVTSAAGQRKALLGHIVAHECVPGLPLSEPQFPAPHPLCLSSCTQTLDAGHTDTKQPGLAVGPGLGERAGGRAGRGPVFRLRHGRPDRQHVRPTRTPVAKAAEPTHTSTRGVNAGVRGGA